MKKIILKSRFMLLMVAMMTLSLTQVFAAETKSYAALFTIKSNDLITGTTYKTYENAEWIITCGGGTNSSSKGVGANSGNRSKCVLGDTYAKYAVSPVTKTNTASAFVSKKSISGVEKISYTFNGGMIPANTVVYLIYSEDGNTFNQMELTSGTQGAAIASGTAYTFAKKTGYFGLLFKATGSGNWRIDNVEITFYAEPDMHDMLHFVGLNGNDTVRLNKYANPKNLANLTATFEYSKDRINWESVTWATDTCPKNTYQGNPIALAKGDTVFFRAKGTNGLNATLSNGTTTCFTFAFGADDQIAAGGNIMSLYDAECKQDTMTGYGFYNLFLDAKQLVSAPKLPAKKMAMQCYGLMFKRCTSLTTAPALPATTLGSACYQGMFNGCTSLTQAPELKATTLADMCYNGTFGGCTSLTVAPALPATTLGKGCYGNMFYDCTSLTQAPKLNATTLADRCYNGMFKGCTSLEVNTFSSSCDGAELEVPTISGTAPTDWNKNMFIGCKGDAALTAATGIQLGGHYCIKEYVEPVCQIGTKGYESIADAVAAVQAGETIQVLKDIQLDAMISVASATPAFTLDLNGHILDGSNLTGNNASLIRNAGTLSIIDSDPTATHEAPFDTIQGAILTGGEGWKSGSKYYGGAIYSKNGTLNVNGVAFVNNSATYGGAAWVDNTNSTFTNCRFYGNIDTDRGAAVGIDNNSQCSIDSCVIKGNSTTLGTIYAYKSSLTIAHTTITGNTSSTNCGAIYVLATSLTLNDGTVITNNTDGSAFPSGGAYVWTDATYKNSITLSGKVIIKDNTSNGQPANLCLSGDPVCDEITLNGLSEGSEVYISTLDKNDAPAPRSFVANATDADLQYFKSDNDFAIVRENTNLMTKDTRDYLYLVGLNGNDTVHLDKMRAESPSTFEYSMDRKTWTAYDTWTTVSQTRQKGNPIALNQGDTVFFRAKGVNGKNATVGTNNAYFTFFFGKDDSIAVGGNIMSLYDATCKQDTMTAYGFYWLFYQNKNLVSASDLKLPAKKLAKNCYESMFDYCTALTDAPEISAETAAKYSCYYMFRGCTSLTTAPALPATKMAENCYQQMFNGCTALTQIPELKADSLAKLCYYGMFMGCTSLQADTCADGSCDGVKFNPTTVGTEPASWGSKMFEGCKGTITKPQLNGHYCIKEYVPIQIVVVYNLQGHGEAIKNDTIISGNKLTQPAKPTAQGYEFRDWYTDAQSMGEKFNFNQTLTASQDTVITLYAKWRDPAAWEQFQKDLNKYSYVEYDSTYEAGFIIHLATTQDAQVQPLKDAAFIEASEEVLANYDFRTYTTTIVALYPAMNDELGKCTGVESPSTLIAAYTQLPYRANGLNAVCGLYTSYFDLVYKAWAETNYDTDTEICKCMLNSDVFFKGSAKLMEAFDASEK